MPTLSQHLDMRTRGWAGGGRGLTGVATLHASFVLHALVVRADAETAKARGRCVQLWARWQLSPPTQLCQLWSMHKSYRRCLGFVGRESVGVASSAGNSRSIERLTSCGRMWRFGAGEGLGRGSIGGQLRQLRGRRMQRDVLALQQREASATVAALAARKVVSADDNTDDDGHFDNSGNAGNSGRLGRLCHGARLINRVSSGRAGCVWARWELWPRCMV